MNDYPDMLHRVRLMRGWVLPEEDIHALGAVLERLDVLEAWFEATQRLTPKPQFESRSGQQ